MSFQKTGQGKVDGGDEGRDCAGAAEEEVEEVVVGFYGTFGGVEEAGRWWGLGAIVIGVARLCSGVGAELDDDVGHESDEDGWLEW